MSISYLIIARLDHEQRGLVLLHPDVEGGQWAAVFLGGVEQHRLVHCYPHGQPGPQRE